MKDLTPFDPDYFAGTQSSDPLFSWASTGFSATLFESEDQPGPCILNGGKVKWIHTNDAIFREAA